MLVSHFTVKSLFIFPQAKFLSDSFLKESLLQIRKVSHASLSGVQSGDLVISKGVGGLNKARFSPDDVEKLSVILLLKP